MSPQDERPTDRLPSLNAIRAFEAVGRLLSYTRAANELNVTPSALSHQVTALEDFFGLPLVRVANNQVALTPIGETYFRQVSQGLTQLSIATSGLLQGKGARVLRVALGYTLATWWFVPMLDRFRAAFPDIILSLSGTLRETDFALGHVDVAILYFTNGLPGGFSARAVKLGRTRIFPVCSPELQNGPHPLTAPADLRHHVLIDKMNDGASAREPQGDWEGWFHASNIDPVTGVGKLSLSPNSIRMQACVQGLGVSLARTLVAAGAIAAGKLVCPFGPAITVPGDYYFFHPASTGNDRLIGDFLNWLIAEVEASTAQVKIPEA